MPITIRYTTGARYDAGASALGTVLTNDAAAPGAPWFLKDYAGNKVAFSATWSGAHGNITKSGVVDARVDAGWSLDASASTAAINVSFASLASFGSELIGSPFDDNITFTASDDRLFGGAGDDKLNGGRGADLMVGGVGNDTMWADNLGDVVVEEVGGGYDTVLADASYVLTAGAEIERFAAAEGVTTGLMLVGNEFGQSISGTAFADFLYGFEGDDLIDGLGGDDTMIGGTGDDGYRVDSTGDRVIEERGAGYDTVTTTLGFYALPDNVEALVATGSGQFIGNALANRITGSSARDVLAGGTNEQLAAHAAGRDMLIGGNGDDVYLVGGVGSRVIEKAGEGTDLVYSHVNFTLDANVEDLTLVGTAVRGVGNAGANAITGNALDNGLFGMDGDDVLTGGGGADVLNGGAGRDTFVYLATTDSTGAARDRIVAFETGVDTIDLSAIDADVATSVRDGFHWIGTSAFSGSAGELRAVTAGNTTFLSGDVDGDGIADLSIVVRGALAAGDILGVAPLTSAPAAHDWPIDRGDAHGPACLP